MQQNDWFRPKSYPHLGLPLSYSDRYWVKELVQNKKKVAEYAFLPFIYRQVNTTKFRKKINEDGSRTSKRFKSQKTRDIYYAAHLDSQIYSYYAHKLRKRYEEKLTFYGISDCVTAYRRIPTNPSDKKSRNKCNIDFAKEVFDFITNSGKEELVAITFDIKSFFDSLDHKKLKKAWYNLLGRKNLPDDHYNLYKSLTHFSYINENQLFNELQDKILVKTKKGKIKKKRVDKLKYLKDDGAVAYCCKKDFASEVRAKGLVKSKKFVKNPEFFMDHLLDRGPSGKVRKIGIPQGTPISAVLANVYMYEFDKTIHKALLETGGLYRRYSDDMVIICKPENVCKLISLVKDEIKNVGLEVQSKKTQIFRFVKKDDAYTCSEWLPEAKKWYDDTNFTYLGFEFDGRYVLIRPATISKYYRKMKRSISRGAFFAKHGNNDDDHIYRRKLYKQFSHLGAGRRRIYERKSETTDEWVISHKYDWGNLITYAMLAAEVMDEPKIMGQVKNHWKILNEEIEKREPE